MPDLELQQDQLTQQQIGILLIKTLVFQKDLIHKGQGIQGILKNLLLHPHLEVQGIQEGLLLNHPRGVRVFQEAHLLLHHQEVLDPVVAAGHQVHPGLQEVPVEDRGLQNQVAEDNYITKSNRMKKSLTLILLLSLAINALAQNEIDALRYSFTNYEGTARFTGLGGAFGSIGSDVSAIGINPASMGRFSKNEFSFTLQSGSNSATSTLYSNTSSISSGNLNIPNVGFVGTHVFKKREHIGWQSVQFGITYNRLNNFNEKIRIEGETPNSYSLVFANWADGTIEDDLVFNNNYDSYLAYDTWLINPTTTGNNTYVSAINGGTNTLKTIERKGNMSSTELALSGNYMNKLYIGGSIGIPNLRYEEMSQHVENVSNDTINDLDNFTFTQTLKTTGSGFNFKLGFVALPTDWFRFGMALQTPTAFRLSDRWQNGLVTNFDDGNEYEASSDPGSYVYHLKTPLKLTGSASVVLLKRAVFSVDYELLDYSKSRLSSATYSTAPYDFNAENEAINTLYNKASTLRLGAEIKLTKLIMARAGIQIKDNPLNEISTKLVNYSVGAGYRINKFYLDIAYVLGTSTENYYLYDPELIQSSPINKETNRAVVTLGFRY